MRIAAGGSCSWTPGQDAILVATLKTARADGLQADKGWKPVVWKNAVTALEGTEIEDGGIPKTVYHVKTRYQKLKSDYRLVKQMRDTSGFDWDPETSSVTAAPSAWAVYLQSHPNAKPFRKKKFPLYEDLADIISGGERAPMLPHVTTEGPVTPAGPSTTVNNGDDESSATNMEKAHDKSQETAGPADTECALQSTSGKTAYSREPKRRRTKSGAASIFVLNELIESVVHTIIDTSEQGPSSHAPLTSLQRRTAAIRTIEQEEGLSDEDMVNVAEIIGERTDIADMYLALTKKATRTAYLRKQLDKYVSK